MPCRCDDRKAELKERGVKPILGKDYTPADAVQYAVIKAFDRITGK